MIHSFVGFIYEYLAQSPLVSSLPCSKCYHILRCLSVHLDAYGCPSMPIHPSIPLSIHPPICVQACIQTTQFFTIHCLPFFPNDLCSQWQTELGKISLARSILEKAGFPAFTRRSTLLS